MEQTYPLQAKKLPHPERKKRILNDDVFELEWNHCLDDLWFLIDDHSLKLIDVLYLLKRSHSDFVGHQLYLACGDANNLSSESAAVFFAAERFSRWGGHYFQTTDALEKLFNRSDVGDTCPASFLRPPFQAVYLSFGQLDSSAFSIRHAETGNHILEGAYVFEGFRDGYRFLDIVLVGKPKAHALDDAIDSMHLIIEDESVTLSKLLEKTIDSTIRLKQGVMTDQDIKNIVGAINHVAKTLLYINSKCGRKQKNFALTENMARIKNLGPQKQARALRKIKYMHDKIVIGPERFNISFTIDKGMSGNAKSPHWRRGHFRIRQKHLMFIDPMLIREDLINDKDLVSKPYLIK